MNQITRAFHVEWLYFCPNLARNYNILSFEFLNIIIDMKAYNVHMYKCYANSLAFNLVEVSAFDLKPQNVHVIRRRLWSCYRRYLHQKPL